MGLAAGAMGLITSASAEEALVAVAANFQTAASQLEADFEANSEHTITITAGSTGKLYAQIVNGAPFDVFLAADQQRPRLLEEKGASVIGSRFTYAVGRLVLWSANPSLAVENSIYLRNGAFRRLAMANPDLAPYGAAAQEILQSLDLWEALQSKIVMGENVTQSFTYVATGNAELGFVALSSVFEFDGGAKSYWEPPVNSYRPIRQDAVLLKRAKSNAAALAFFQYLKSEPARELISSSGYGDQ
ncbi:molybdate ABC transporter substrate-binding protein [Hyphococcus flavus]|uniref:Molybdate ABC transporter substrate-binding protein n=1 Tax=Hyphococcus flavus TaxID=1866326 RepID=A0AAE9ZJK9_9PROT|nr:molybdate ABC transporter substrate-binding protein [Hyphococcus flavus]WDI31740.1 molybdate ABC transporter substrate-binding protein [Hyphococcus flavus]